MRLGGKYAAYSPIRVMRSRNTLDVQLAFEASVHTSAGLKLSLVFVNIQETQEFKRGYTNTVDVTFNLSKGSTASIY